MNWLTCMLVIGMTGAVFFWVPPAEGLGSLVRIAYFHIPMAWVSVLAFLVSAYYASCYLRSRELRYDIRSAISARLGILFCFLATVSGAVFAKLTWGTYWNWDPRQTTIFLLLLIYGAYLVLRISVRQDRERAKLSAVYALLAFVTVPFLVFVVPRTFPTLHPEPVLNASGKMEMEPVMVTILLAAVAVSTLVYWRILLHLEKKANASVTKHADCMKEENV